MVDRLLHPVGFPALLTLVAFPLDRVQPGPLLDDSWRLGLSWAHVLGLHAGGDWVFTYGPLGFLATPNLVWTAGAGLGIAYTAAVTFAYLALGYRWALEWLPRWVAAAAMTALAFALTLLAPFHQLPPMPEAATAAILIAALWLVRPSVLDAALAPHWPALLAAAATLQLLVKFSTGVVALAACAVVVVARPRRLVNLAAGVGGACLAFAALWLAAGQDLADAPHWLRLAFDVSSGYSAGQALGSFPSTSRDLVFIAVPTIVVLVALAHDAWSGRMRALPTVALGVLGVWFAAKAGLIRSDYSHTIVAMVILAALCTAVPWRSRGLGGAALGWCVVAMIVSAAAAGSASVLDVLDAAFVEHPRIVANGVRGVVDISYRRDQILAAARDVRRTDAIPASVLDAVRGSSVHAEPWDIAVVWANGLRWQPELGFQSYSTYTEYLDRESRAHLAGSHAPEAVLQQTKALDGKLAEWESPGYQTGLVCRYRLVAEESGWRALRRGTDRCGTPVPLGQATVEGDETARVPDPSDPSSLVVATVEYPTSLLQRLVTLAVKPTTTPLVTLDGAEHRFVPAHAGSQHLLRVPGDDGLLHGGMDVHRIGFPDATGPVTLRFFEIPVRDR